MKTGTVIGLTIAAIAGYALLAKKSASGSLVFYPASVRNIKFQGSTPIMTVGLVIQNPTNQKFVVKSLAGNLFANNYLVGNLSSFQTTEILPNSEVILYVEIRLSLISIVNDIIRAFQFGNFSQDLLLKATANVDNYPVPLTLNYKVG